MTTGRFPVLFAATILFSSPAFGSGVCKPLPPIEDFICNSDAAHFMCGLQVKTALLDSAVRAEAEACIVKRKQTLQRLYAATHKHLAGNPTALAALKEHYSYWLTSMDLLWPAADMRQYQYEAQSQARSAGLLERANRLKIEAQ